VSAKPDPAAIAAAIPLAAATPIYGEYAIIVLAALFGSLVALSKMQPDAARSRWFIALFIFRGVAVASVAAGVIASWLSAATGVEFYRWLGLAAFLIAYAVEDLPKVKDMALQRWGNKE